MAPNSNRESFMAFNKNTASSSSSSSSRVSESMINHNKLPSLSMESLHRTISDISLELITMQALSGVASEDSRGRDVLPLPEIPEAKPREEEEVARCECCGMGEECTAGYVARVRAEFVGRFVCGLCAEAVAEEMAKSRSPREEAVGAHMADCSRFNRLARSYPSLFQAQDVKEILKKTCSDGARAKSLSPRSYLAKTSNGLTRSSSCIPAIRKES